MRRRPAWRHPAAPYNSPAPSPAHPAHTRAVFIYRYRGFIYTSFQERATKISHGNVGKLLAGAGDQFGAKICARIAGDEARHSPPSPRTPAAPFPTFPAPSPRPSRPRLQPPRLVRPPLAPTYLPTYLPST